MEFPVNSGLPSLSLEEFSWLSRSQLWQKLPDFRGRICVAWRLQIYPGVYSFGVSLQGLQ